MVIFFQLMFVFFLLLVVTNKLEKEGAPKGAYYMFGISAVIIFVTAMFQAVNNSFLSSPQQPAIDWYRYIVSLIMIVFAVLYGRTDAPKFIKVTIYVIAIFTLVMNLIGQLSFFR